MIKVTLEFGSTQDLLNFFAPPVAAAIAPETINPPTTPPALPVKRPGRPPKAKAAVTEQPQATVGTNGASGTQVNSESGGSLAAADNGAPPADPVSPAPAAGPSVAGPTPSADDLRAAAMAVTEKHGQVKGMDLLRVIMVDVGGVRLLRDVPEGKRAAVIESCKKALEVQP